MTLIAYLTKHSWAIAKVTYQIKVYHAQYAQLMINDFIKKNPLAKKTLQHLFFLWTMKKEQG